MHAVVVFVNVAAAVLIILLAALRGVAGKKRTATQILAWRCSSAGAYGRFSQGFRKVFARLSPQRYFRERLGRAEKSLINFCVPRGPPPHRARGTQKLVRTIATRGRRPKNDGERTKNFKRPKNREDSSDFDDFLTKTIALTRSSFFKNICVAEIFSSAQTFFRQRTNFRKNRSGRRNAFRPKVVKIGAILAIFQSF